STTQHFGVYCRYSTNTRYNMYYFDDFYVGEIIQDTIAPEVMELNVVSATQLEVLFSEEIEITTAENTANYFIDNGIGNPVSAQLDANDNRLVHLTLSGALQSPGFYNLSIENIEDF